MHIKGPPPPAYLSLDVDTFKDVVLDKAKDVLVGKHHSHNMLFAFSTDCYFKAFTAPWW